MSVKPLVSAGYTESVTNSSKLVSQMVVGNSTETEGVDWPGLALVLLELGVVEGSLAGNIGLNKPISHIGT